MPSAMLVRRKVNALVRIDCTEWSKDFDLTTDSESVTATAHFEDGQTVERTATIRYEPGTREEIIAAVRGETGATHAIWKRADEFRKGHWQTRQNLIGEMHREYAAGLR